VFDALIFENSANRTNTFQSFEIVFGNTSKSKAGRKMLVKNKEGSNFFAWTSRN
jgi:hypothetical protein